MSDRRCHNCGEARGYHDPHCPKSPSMTKREATNRRWRVGRKLGRTVYAMVGPVVSDEDVCIGMFDSSLIAKAAVEAHNAALSRTEPS